MSDKSEVEEKTEVVEEKSEVDVEALVMIVAIGVALVAHIGNKLYKGYERQKEYKKAWKSVASWFE